MPKRIASEGERIVMAWFGPLSPNLSRSQNPNRNRNLSPSQNPNRNRNLSPSQNPNRNRNLSSLSRPRPK